MIVKKGSYILIIALILSFASLFYSFLTISNLVVNFLLTTVLFFIYKRNNIEPFFLLSLIALLSSLIITNMNFSALGSSFILLNLFMYCYLFNNLFFINKYCIMVRLFFSLLLVMYCSTCNNSLLFYYQTTTDALGNIVNGNHLGYLALINYFNITILLKNDIKVHSKKTNIFLIILTIFTAIYINLTGCRAALFSIIIYVMLIASKQNPFDKHFFEQIIRLELIACLIFPLFYVYLSNVIADFEILGKSLFSGRELLWKSGFEIISQYPIFGSGNDFIYSVGDKAINSSHNFVLGVIKMFGIIPTMVLIYIFPLTSIQNENKTRQFVMISTLCIGFTEASFIASHSTLFFMLLFLQSYENHRTKQKVILYA